MPVRSQTRWALGAAACAVVVARFLLHGGDEAPPTVPAHMAVTGERERAPSRATRPPTDVVMPSPIAAPADDVSDSSDSVRGRDDRPAAQRRHALTHARLRRARREARLRATRHVTAPVLIDADGVAVPLDVWAQGERFATATPVEASELAEPLGGSRGSVSFWFQPQWSAGSQDDASFLEIADGFVRVVKNVDFVRFEFVDADGVEHGLGASITDWNPGEWHQIAGSWDDGTVALYFDGELVGQATIDTPLVLPHGPRMRVGSDFPEFRPVAAGVVGGVRVTARPLSADEVRQRFVVAYG